MSRSERIWPLEDYLDVAVVSDLMPNALFVFGPTTPSAARPLLFWNNLIAAAVFDPKYSLHHRLGTQTLLTHPELL